MFICGQPSDVYISIGPSPTIDIFSMDYPPIIFLVLDNPLKPFSLDSSHALAPTVLGCPSAYGMHDANSIAVYNTCKYINMHIFT